MVTCRYLDKTLNSTVGANFGIFSNHHAHIEHKFVHLILHSNPFFILFKYIFSIFLFPIIKGILFLRRSDIWYYKGGVHLTCFLNFNINSLAEHVLCLLCNIKIYQNYKECSRVVYKREINSIGCSATESRLYWINTHNDSGGINFLCLSQNLYPMESSGYSCTF